MIMIDELHTVCVFYLPFFVGLSMLFLLFQAVVPESGGKAFNGWIQTVESEAVCMKVKIKVRTLRWTHQ